MIPYPKIHSPYKRDDAGKFTDEWSKPWFSYLLNSPWIGSEKVDGMNMRVSTADGYAGRSDAAVIPHPLDEVMIFILNTMRLKGLDGLTLYGEGYGAGIQKGGGRYRPDKAFVLFDVLTDRGRWLDRPDVMGIANDIAVPYAPEWAPRPLYAWIDAIRNGDDQESRLHRGAGSEGFVLRPTVELRDTFGERIITKLKFKDFLTT